MIAELRATLQVGLMIVFAAALLENSAANPNYLKPIRAYHPDGYDQAVFGALIGKSYPELWMICRPSFTPESALILRTELLAPEPSPPAPPSPRRWILEHATAAQQIWHYKEQPPGYSGFSELDLRKDVQVNRRSLEIDEKLGQEIKKAWESVLRLTRYPDEDDSGLDGVTYQFYVEPDYFGETWSPRKGLPKQLVELAGLLTKVTECAPDERKTILAECEAKARALQRATASQPKPKTTSK